MLNSDNELRQFNKSASSTGSKVGIKVSLIVYIIIYIIIYTQLKILILSTIVLFIQQFVFLLLLLSLYFLLIWHISFHKTLHIFEITLLVLIYILFVYFNNFCILSSKAKNIIEEKIMFEAKLVLLSNYKAIFLSCQPVKQLAVLL